MKRLTLVVISIVMLLAANAFAVETALTSDSYNHEYPEYSPDGNWIAYQKFDSTGYYQIYKVSSSGGAETQLTSSPYNHSTPQWSPDGSAIVYSVAWPPDRIATVSSSGGPENFLTGTDQARLFPSFSPDGSRIAFHKAFGGGVYQIFTMPSTGGGETQLTFGNTSSDARWSPDGQWVAYAKEEPIASGIYQIYKIPSGGGIEVALTSDYSTTSSAHSWSPNNLFICFRKLVGLYYQIFTISSNGSGLTQLTNDSYAHGSPNWSPSTQFICYNKRLGTYWQLFIIQRVGGSEIQMTFDSYNHLRPKFSPSGAKILYQKQDSTGFWQIYVADLPESLTPLVSTELLIIMGIILLTAMIISTKRKGKSEENSA